MISNSELDEVNRKLSLLIGMNIAAMIILVFGFFLIILFNYAWVIMMVILVAITHVSITIYLHIKMKKHTDPR